MKKEQIIRNYLVGIYYVLLWLPVVTFVFFTQVLNLGIFEHATLGGFIFILAIVVVVGYLYVNNYQRLYVKIANIVMTSFMGIIFVINMLVKFLNGYRFTPFFYLQVLAIALFVLIAFVPDIFHKGFNPIVAQWKKLDGFLREKEKTDNSSKDITKEIETEHKDEMLEIEEEFEDFGI